MRAFAIFRSGGFGPEEIARLDAILANAWKELRGRYASVHGESEPEARERLARIIVTLARATIDDEELIAAAIAGFEGTRARPASKPNIQTGTPPSLAPRHRP
jgi:hypothetical protein